MYKCLKCDKELNGKQTKFCSHLCKCSFHNKEKQSYIAQQKRGHARKKEFIEMKGGRCKICEYNKCFRALTFHHREPSEKSFNLDIRSLSNRTYNKCINELEKCDLLCFNCHMELHENE